MKSQLIVKNFGPIDDVKLDLRNVNVFIGPQASGKSALAKLFTIFKAPRKFIDIGVAPTFSINIRNTAFNEVLEEYNIASFLKSNTEIEFDSALHFLSYKANNLTYQTKLHNKIQSLQKLKKDFINNKGLILAEITSIYSQYLLLRDKILFILNNHSNLNLNDSLLNKLNEDYLTEIIAAIKETESHLSTNAALYIPSERNFSNIIKASAVNLMLHKVPIPVHLLQFGAELEKSPVETIDLGFLHENLVYKNINGDDRIFIDSNNNIKLIEAAAGIQSVVPILIPILSRSDNPHHKSFVIEEPELNLFPIAQYELIKLLESSRETAIGEDYGTIHTYTTHSPYILSALNNLLYANKVKNYLRSKTIKPGRINLNGAETAVNNIIPAEIYPDHFTAYQIYNGNAESIFDRETGLIKDNYIDEASDKMADDFDALMNLMK